MSEAPQTEPRRRVRACAVCHAEGHLLVVRLRDPVSEEDALFPPGGAIELGESPAAAARRETLEETGVRVRVDSEAAFVDHYPYRWAGVDYAVTTHYLAASLEGPFDRTLPPVADAPYNLGASWLPLSDALDAMSIHPAIAAATARVARLGSLAAWGRHPNVVGPASTLLSIHGQFREASRGLGVMLDREDATDLAWVGRAFRRLAQTLHHHHHAEEALLFPVIHERTGTAPERLVRDHETLTRAIAAVEESLTRRPNEESRRHARAVIATFHQLLATHLDREELLVMPVLLAMPAHEAWAMIRGE